MEKTLTPQEIDERVAILKRFRRLLEEQRNKFREYLSVLEKQEEKIADDDGEGMLAHSDLQNQILRNIEGLQKVIVPMQSVYNNVAGSVSSEDSASVTQVQSDLASLRQKVLAQNERNQSLIQVHMAQVRSQLEVFARNNPYRGKHSIYAEKTTVGKMLAIKV